jgi:hypothetical protein
MAASLGYRHGGGWRRQGGLPQDLRASAGGDSRGWAGDRGGPPGASCLRSLNGRGADDGHQRGPRFRHGCTLNEGGEPPGEEQAHRGPAAADDDVQKARR